MLNDTFISLQNLIFSVFGYFSEAGDITAPPAVQFWINGLSFLGTIALAVLPYVVIYKVVTFLVR